MDTIANLYDQYKKEIPGMAMRPNELKYKIEMNNNVSYTQISRLCTVTNVTTNKIVVKIVRLPIVEHISYADDEQGIFTVLLGSNEANLFQANNVELWGKIISAASINNFCNDVLKSKKELTEHDLNNAEEVFFFELVDIIGYANAIIYFNNYREKFLFEASVVKDEQIKKRELERAKKFADKIDKVATLSRFS